MVTAFILLFGLIIGSFLNVVIHRLPRDASVVTPRSQCPECSQPIPWEENIPLVSFLLLRGKCSTCGKKIHWRYPFVEFLTAILFWLTFHGHLFDLDLFRAWWFISIGICVIFIDIDFRIIPNELSIGGAFLGLSTGYWDSQHSLSELVLAAAVGYLGFLAVGWLYHRFTGRVGLGGGDMKFMATIGAFLGFGGIWTTLIVSSFLGVIFGLMYGAIKNRNEVLKTALPFGPFLVIGAWVELFFEVSKWMNM